MVEKLLNFDIIFLIEHWLRDDEQYLINEIALDHSVIFRSHMELPTSNRKRTRGRPHGCTCWLIKKSLDVVAHENFNNII